MAMEYQQNKLSLECTFHFRILKWVKGPIFMAYVSTCHFLQKIVENWDKETVGHSSVLSQVEP